jgi:hypothetical protein
MVIFVINVYRFMEIKLGKMRIINSLLLGFILSVVILLSLDVLVSWDNPSYIGDYGMFTRILFVIMWITWSAFLAVEWRRIF